MSDVLVIGGGVTGLAAAIASRGVCLEATNTIGGLAATDESRGYTVGYSGHWFFGGSIATQRWLVELTGARRVKKSAFAMIGDRFIKTPIQENYGELDDSFVIGQELAADREIRYGSFAAWLRSTFGDTLYHTFFGPFNRKYTVGLMYEVEPMAMRNVVPVPGRKSSTYNDTFLYVPGGTDRLVIEMAKRCEGFYFDSEVVKIDPNNRKVYTSDAVYTYKKLITTIPLKELTKILPQYGVWEDLPHLSGIVVNVGCEEVNFPGQWVYVPDRHRFHRIGNYTAVDPFLAPKGKHLVYMDVNTRSLNGSDLSGIPGMCVDNAVNSGLISGPEFVEVRTIPYSYTFTKAGQRVTVDALLRELSEYGIYSIGGYGRWQYQGMMADIEEGFRVGAMVRRM